MPSEVFEFVWTVEVQGYRWITEKLMDDRGHPNAFGERELCSPMDCRLAATYRRRQYDPVRDHPALFRTFAEVAPSKEGILAFANRFGMLGKPRFTENTDPKETGRIPGICGEPLSLWKEQISKLKQAVELWELINVRIGLG